MEQTRRTGLRRVSEAEPVSTTIQPPMPGMQPPVMAPGGMPPPQQPGMFPGGPAMGMQSSQPPPLPPLPTLLRPTGAPLSQSHVIMQLLGPTRDDIPPDDSN